MSKNSNITQRGYAWAIGPKKTSPVRHASPVRRVSPVTHAAPPLPHIRQQGYSWRVGSPPRQPSAIPFIPVQSRPVLPDPSTKPRRRHVSPHSSFNPRAAEFVPGPSLNPRASEFVPRHVSPPRHVPPPREHPNIPEDVLDNFRCPLTLEIMNDPVMDPEGNSYERTAIEDWLLIHGTSPLTRTRMTVADLTPNVTLRNVIQDLISRKGGRMFKKSRKQRGNKKKSRSHKKR